MNDDGNVNSKRRSRKIMMTARIATQRFEVPKSPIQRVASHYGVGETDALQVLSHGYALPPSEKGLQGIFTEFKEHPIPWILIGLFTLWVFRGAFLGN